MFGLSRCVARGRAPRAAVTAAVTAALGVLGAPAREARAGGLEIPDTGGIALGRAGAFAARASDPTALIHNTAGIVGLNGVQVTLGLNTGILSHCFQRTGNYDNADVAYIDTTGTVFERSNYAASGARTPYPRVCNNTDPAITPHLLATFRVNRQFALGFGFYAPNTTGSRQNFPDTVMTSAGLAPSPARYLIFEKSLLAGYLTFAAAYAPVPWLRFGAALQPSFASFYFGTMINIAAASAQSPSADLRLGLNASGFFLAGNVAVQVLPSPYFGFGAQFHINPEVILQGEGTVIGNPYAPMESQRTQGRFRIDRMAVPLPSILRAGARFIWPRAGRPHQADVGYDAMRDDVFDIEAGFMYETTSSLSTIALQNSGQISVAGAMVNAPSPVTVLSEQRNAFGFRLGSDVNVLPDRLAVRAGVAYETGSATPRLAVLHTPSFETVSLHAGLTFRYRWFNVHLAYAHYFFFPIDASSGENTGTRSPIVAMNAPPNAAAWAERCMMPDTGPGACRVNQGTYNATFDALSLAFNFQF